jgi:hypothetical protein
LTARHDPGPRRSESIDFYLRETRAIAAVALLALVAGVVSDVLAPRFWSHHALLAGLTSSVITVLLTVALVNEAVERRKRQRWSVLAQYAMFQLVRDTRRTPIGTGSKGCRPGGRGSHLQTRPRRARRPLRQVGYGNDNAVSRRSRPATAR